MKKSKIKELICVLKQEIASLDNRLHDLELDLTKGKTNNYGLGELPEKWCVKASNETELELIHNKICTKPEAKELCYYYHSPATDNDDCWAHFSVKKGYTEISFETFKRLVLKEEEKVPNISPSSYYEYVGKKSGLIVLTDINKHEDDLLVYGTCVHNSSGYDIAVVGQHRVWAKSALKPWSGELKIINTPL